MAAVAAEPPSPRLSRKRIAVSCDWVRVGIGSQPLHTWHLKIGCQRQTPATSISKMCANVKDIAPCSVYPEAAPSLGGGGARNLASEVISTAVSPESVIARESGGHLGGEGDHGDADRDGGG